MARPLRIEYPGAVYHVTARGNERKPIYRDDRDRARFLDLLAEVGSRFHLRVHAYVLMRNHYHLLVETLEANLSRALRHVNGVYTQSFNRRHRRAGHLFQGRYKAYLVDKDSYLLELSRYIHLNPVRVGEVDEPARWRWSSAAAYVGKRAPEPFVYISEVLSLFGEETDTAQRKYIQFLDQGTPASTRPWDNLVSQTLLGRPEWIDRMRQSLRKRGIHTEVPASRQLAPRPSIKTIVDVTSRHWNIDPAVLMKPRGGHGSAARAAAMHLGCEVGGLPHLELARVFGVTVSAVSKGIARVRTRVDNDHALRTRLAAVIAEVRT